MYREALNEALREELYRDETVFVIGGGIGQRGGSYKVTVGLLDEFGPRRIIDTPISEASFTGAGVGAAITGMRPVVEILFVDFASLIIDQIVNQAAKYRFMSGGRGRVPMVLRTQGGSGNGLAAQHSQSLEAWYYPAGHIRKKLEKIFTEEHGQFLAELEALRKRIIKDVAEPTERKALLGELADDKSFEYFIENGPAQWRTFAEGLIKKVPPLLSLG